MTAIPAWVKLDAEGILSAIENSSATKAEMTKYQPKHCPGPYTTQCINEAWRWLYSEGYFIQVGTNQSGQWLYAKA